MKIKSHRNLCVLFFAVTALASHSSIAQVDCSESPVSLGEVMAGFQAGFTGGTHTVTGLPEGMWASASSDPRRGFIVPETEVTTLHCRNDYILLAEWFGCMQKRPNGTTRRPVEEAKDCAKTGMFGLIVDFHFLLDGIRVDHMETTAKLGPSPYGPDAAVYAILTAGHIIEPFSLSPGTHTVTPVFVFDWDRNGTIDEIWEPVVDFEIIDSTATP